jgi:hypothetical protein
MMPPLVAKPAWSQPKVIKRYEYVFAVCKAAQVLFSSSLTSAPGKVEWSSKRRSISLKYMNPELTCVDANAQFVTNPNPAKPI